MLTIGMKKVIRKWGSGGLAVYFNSDERKAYELNEGDIIDIEIVKVTKPKITYDPILKPGRRKK